MKLKRKKRRVPVVPLTSFGDIAFLLIIFFVLSSQFMRESHIHVDEPTAPDLEDMPEAMVSVVMDSDGAVWLQGQPCPISVLKLAVEELVSDKEDKTVLLKIDKNQEQRAFGDVFIALSEAGADIILLGRKEMNEG